MYIQHPKTMENDYSHSCVREKVIFYLFVLLSNENWVKFVKIFYLGHVTQPTITEAIRWSHHNHLSLERHRSIFKPRFMRGHSDLRVASRRRYKTQSCRSGRSRNEVVGMSLREDTFANWYFRNEGCMFSKHCSPPFPCCLF